ncbi:hypothetical protein GCM10028806_32590 [Spirosoma terrae]
MQNGGAYRPQQCSQAEKASLIGKVDRQRSERIETELVRFTSPVAGIIKIYANLIPIKSNNTYHL